MITLKKQYTVAITLNAAALSIMAISQIRQKNGHYVFTQTGQKGLYNIATGIAVVASITMMTAHVRGASRVVKVLAKAVTK